MPAARVTVQSSCVGAHAHGQSSAACAPPSTSTTPHQLLCTLRCCSHAAAASCGYPFHICFSTASALNPQAVFCRAKNILIEGARSILFSHCEKLFYFNFYFYFFSIILLCLQMLYSIMCAIENQLSAFYLFTLFGSYANAISTSYYF